MLSIWEKNSFTHYDIVVVGAGISGLSCAASLKEAHPSLRVLVLERGLLPTGASTKNAGFACFGSLTELLDDKRNMGEEAMLKLVEKRWKGLQKTRNRLGDSTIDLQLKGGYELLDHSLVHTLDEMGALNESLKDLFGKDVFQDQSDRIDSFGFRGFEALVYNAFEGQLDTGKLVASLWDYCSQLGVRIQTGAEVKSFEHDGGHVKVATESLDFLSRKLILCTNAFTPALTSAALKPGRGFVMAIKPRVPINFEGTFHYDEGFYYFRDYNDHVIFGGGRNLDFEGESTTDFGVNAKVKERLIQDLETRIMPDKAYEIELEWSGIMAFGSTKAPIIEEVESDIFVGARLGGMGVAIGSLVGEELASKILQSL